jgi:hypothetical protein
MFHGSGDVEPELCDGRTIHFPGLERSTFPVANRKPVKVSRDPERPGRVLTGVLQGLDERLLSAVSKS